MKKKTVRIGSSWKIVRVNVDGLTLDDCWIGAEIYVFDKFSENSWAICVYKTPNHENSEINEHRIQAVEQDIFDLYMEEVTPLQMRRVELK